MIETFDDSRRGGVPGGHSREVRRLIATDYTRQMIAGAIHESLVEAFHIRVGGLAADERAWVRDWLTIAVPRLTERTVASLAIQLEVGLRGAPPGLFEALDERRRRAALGVE